VHPAALTFSAAIESFTQLEQVERVPIIRRVPLDFPALVLLFPSGSIYARAASAFPSGADLAPF
jgi:hypothetical protein